MLSVQKLNAIALMLISDLALLQTEEWTLMSFCKKHKWICSQWSCLSPNLMSFGLYTTNLAALFLLSLRPSSPFQFNDILYFVVHILKPTLLTTEFYEQDCSLPLHCSAYALCSFPPSTSLELTLELLVTPFVHVLFMVSDKSCSLE